MSHPRKGFTLIELLIVVVIIGILAAIAIPKFADTKRKAIVTSVKSDLKNLIPSAEAHFSDNNTYANWAPANVGSTGVTITFGTRDATGWAATGTHTGTGVSCVIGTGGQTPSGLVEGVPGGANCR